MSHVAIDHAPSGLRWLALDSPAKRNALSVELLTELLDALDDAMASESVRAIVVTSQQDVFCSGADLKEPRPTADDGGSDPVVPPSTELFVQVLRRLHWGPKPTIVYVDGAVRGGGIGLVAAADIVVADERASFAFSEVRLGVIPALISLPVLERMSRPDALRYFLTGEPFGGQPAAEAGLVDIYVRSSERDAILGSIADALALGAPSALSLAKRLVREHQPAVGEAAWESQLWELARESASIFVSPDAQEGIAAFRERRQPRWTI